MSKANTLGLLMLSLLSSGCLTQKVLAVGAGVEWLDPYTPPPHSRIAPDTLVLCLDGSLELHADAFPPPDVQWIRQSGSPVRVVSFGKLRRPDAAGAKSANVQYADVHEDECGWIASSVRISIATAAWYPEAGTCSRSA